MQNYVKSGQTALAKGAVNAVSKSLSESTHLQQQHSHFSTDTKTIHRKTKSFKLGLKHLNIRGSTAPY